MTTFNHLDTFQQRETYIKARKASDNTDMPIILYCFVLGGNLYYANTFDWPAHKAMEVCTFRHGRELQ